MRTTLSKITLVLLLIPIITSCRLDYFKNENIRAITKNPQMTLYKVTEKPQDSLLLGTWEVDSFSYEYIKEVIDMDNKKVTISLRNNRQLIGSNLPNFSVSDFDKPTKLVNPKGEWKLNQSYKKDRWQITMAFERHEEKHYGFSGYYDIYKRNDSLFLWKFIGDPDSGNRLLFKKKD